MKNRDLVNRVFLDMSNEELADALVGGDFVNTILFDCAPSDKTDKEIILEFLESELED